MVTKGDEFTPLIQMIFFSCDHERSHEVTWQIRNAVPPSSQNFMITKRLNVEVQGVGAPSYQVFLRLDYMITYQRKFQMKLRFFPTRINKYKTWLWETCSEMWYGQIMLNMPQRFRALGSCFYYYRTDLLIIQHLSCNQKRLLLEDKHLQYFWLRAFYDQQMANNFLVHN